MNRANRRRAKRAQVRSTRKTKRASARSRGASRDKVAPRKTDEPSIELQFFRTLNRVVEPMVRAGIGSPRIVPSGFIVLETRGRNTGHRRRTPLAATRIGDHVFVATFRAGRSQWLRNLAAQPHTRFWLGGKPRDAKAFLVYEGRRVRVPASLPAWVQTIVRLVTPFTEAGWAFAILSPPTERIAVQRRARRNARQVYNFPRKR